MRSQASLELLILLAAMFAFFTAFLPVIKQAVELAEFSSAAKTNEAAFIHLAGMAKEAFLLGKGNRLSASARLEGNGSLWFNESTAVLWMDFSRAGHSKKLSASVDFSFKLNQTPFSSGYYLLRVENAGAAVEAFIGSGQGKA